MKDPYAFGFYSACFALVVVVAAVFYSAAVSTSPGSAANAYYIVEAASSLSEALAVIGIAGVVFKAYGSWKRETRQQKALSIIWDANVAFREIEIGFNEWFFGPTANQKSGTMSARSIHCWRQALWDLHSGPSRSNAFCSTRW